VSFLDNVKEILQTAEAARQPGQPASEFTILYRADDGILLIADCDWPLDRLAADRGARELYRVSQNGDRLRVDALAGHLSCRLESRSPSSVARRLLGGSIHYPIS
jgi:hypothetical protein